MPNYPIKLGRKMNGGPCCAELKVDPYGDGEHYPTLYLEWDESYDLPDSGEMVVKFKKVSETNSKNNHGEKQSVSLDITEIKSVKADKNEAKIEAAEDALDRLKKEVDAEEKPSDEEEED